ncbi:hypothetical protein CCHR01_07707 [Colletotrichum chrysophilum]|uniref:Uncharacterized protein n=1 Tax=Colletotrichum chrysophilum TaxID=1836956 RepID=A0AAD9AMK5_9PEZI|nr:hypothetical protein CCHR01_07707 [Colletotrichum chrysophilum]
MPLHQEGGNEEELGSDDEPVTTTIADSPGFTLAAPKKAQTSQDLRRGTEEGGRHSSNFTTAFRTAPVPSVSPNATLLLPPPHTEPVSRPRPPCETRPSMADVYDTKARHGSCTAARRLAVDLHCRTLPRSSAPPPHPPPPRLCLIPNAVAAADGTDQTDCGVKEHTHTLVKLAIDALLVRCRTCCDERPSHDEPYRTRQRLPTCQLRRRLVSVLLRHPPANGK